MLLLTLPAAAVLVGGLVTAWQTRHGVEMAVHVDGIVTGLEPSGTTDNGSKTFKAIVNAKTPDGVPIRITDFWAVSPSPKIGATWALSQLTSWVTLVVRVSMRPWSLSTALTLARPVVAGSSK